jgi:D-sedoheptulose 7-phosphate isomerase
MEDCARPDDIVVALADNPSLNTPAHRTAEHLRETIAVQEQVATRCTGDIIRAAELITAALRGGAKLMICGNGGSAADAQHIAAELVGRLRKEVERPGLAAIALTTDTSILTAYANDFDFEGVFSRQVEALGRPGDVLLGISTSGTSANVVRAIGEARRRQLRTIALVGAGGSMSEPADVTITVPSRSTAAVQESMLPIEHILCELVEDALFRTDVD